MDKVVGQYLQKHGITFVLHKHKPVFTVSESKEECAHIPGLHCKNLFLHDSKDDQFYLVVMPAYERLNMKSLQEKLHVKKLRFAKEEALWDLLKLKPGSVSPLGLINDAGHHVIAVIAKSVWDAHIVGFHPNDNSATLEVEKDSFHALMDSFANKKVIVDLSE